MASWTWLHGLIRVVVPFGSVYTKDWIEHRLQSRTMRINHLVLAECNWSQKPDSLAQMLDSRVVR